MTTILIILGGISVCLISTGIMTATVKSWSSVERVSQRRTTSISKTLIYPLVAYLAGQVRTRFSDSYLDSIERKLVFAGKPGGGISAAEYVALVSLAGFGALVLLLMLNLATGGLTLGGGLFAILISSAIIWLGMEYLNTLISNRRTQISRLFPYFLDLSVMTMEAGTGFLETIDIYIRDSDSNALGDELRQTVSEIRMGKTFEDALRNLESRITAEEVQNTLRALLQGGKMGTPLGLVLRDQAQMIRFKRSQLAERAAEEIKVRMQGPSMLLMLSVLLLILGPAFIGMFGSGVI